MLVAVTISFVQLINDVEKNTLSLARLTLSAGGALQAGNANLAIQIATPCTKRRTKGFLHTRHIFVLHKGVTFQFST